MSVQVFKKLSPALKEVRIHLCPKSASGNGVRQFVDNYYVSVKGKNPNLPILIRECTGVEPKMWLRFEYGRETNASLVNLDGKQIVELLNKHTTNG